MFGVIWLLFIFEQSDIFKVFSLLGNGIYFVYNQDNVEDKNLFEGQLKRVVKNDVFNDKIVGVAERVYRIVDEKI